MVEYSLSINGGLDHIFASLSDPTRRDILRRVAKEEMTISEISKPYKLTFAAISKHLKVLEKAQLIIKKRRGKEQVVRLAPKTIGDAACYLDGYKHLWKNGLDRHEHYLSSFTD